MVPTLRTPRNVGHPADELRMSEQELAKPANTRSTALFSVSATAGLILVIAAFRFAWLNWVVDAPGWVVSRFTSIDFHEGEGAAGFLIALLLSWFWTAAAVYMLGNLLITRIQLRRPTRIPRS